MLKRLLEGKKYSRSKRYKIQSLIFIEARVNSQERTMPTATVLHKFKRLYRVPFGLDVIFHQRF